MLAESAVLQRALAAGDPGADLPVAAPGKRAALLEECRQSLRPVEVRRRPMRWIWPAAVGFATAGFALVVLQTAPRRSAGIVAPAPHSRAKAPMSGAALRAASRAVMAIPQFESRPGLKPSRQPETQRLASRPGRLASWREHRLRQLVAAPAPLSVRRIVAAAEEKPPLVVVEAEGGAPTPYTVTVTATGSNAVVTRAAYEETHP